MSFSLKSQSSWFYFFMGAHSFLMGLFLFFVPVWLWKQGFDLRTICAAIAIIGASFCLALWGWDRLRTRISVAQMGNLSFLVGVLAIATIFTDYQLWFVPLLACIIGVYNCLMWVTQRALFLELIDPQTSGKTYGNLQLFVFGLLQLGIFAGAYLNDNAYYGWLFLLIAGVSMLSGAFLTLSQTSVDWPTGLKAITPMSLKDIFSFKDAHGSRTIFLLDGVFLFFESWFWLLSLFLISGESFWNLGALVIGLALVFAILFWGLKNSLDRWEEKGIQLYSFVIWLYAISWLLRGYVIHLDSLTLIGVSLIMIIFFTTYFRLIFNKKFYDIAHKTIGHRYLILKSYYSQIVLFVIFGGITLLWQPMPSDMEFWYYFMGLLTLGYFWYDRR